MLHQDSWASVEEERADGAGAKSEVVEHQQEQRSI